MKSKKQLDQNTKTSTVQFVKSDIKLSISLLVSNRIDTIRKCMESLRPLLEQLPSELIVVDTVGEEDSDGSLAVAREYTDKIVRFQWCNDFSAARNAGLSKAQGEWFLYLDDDEWFDDVAPIIEFIKNDDGKYNFCHYYARNYLDYSGLTYKDALVGRMVRRSNHTVFKDKIHEYISGAFTPSKILNCFVHHYGYVFSNQSERLAKIRRNIVPLEEMLAEDPKNLRAIAQLCQEYINTQDYEKIRELSEKAMEFGLETKNMYMGYIIDCYIKALYLLNETENLLGKAEFLLGHTEVTELTKAGICRFIQNVDSEKFPAERALFYVDTYFFCIDDLDKDPDMFSSQAFLTLGEYQTPQNREEMLLRALHLCKQLGNQDKIWAYLQKCCVYGEQSEVFLISNIQPLLEASLASGKFAQFCECLDPVLQEKSFLLFFLQAVNEFFTKESETIRLESIRIISELPYNHPYIILQKLKLAKAEGQTQNLTELVEAYASEDIESIPSDEILMFCYHNQVSPAPLIGKLFIETWELTVDCILAQISLDEHGSFIDFFQQFWNPISPEMLYFNAASQFYTLSLSIKEEPDSPDFDEVFVPYIEANEAYYRKLYHPDNFNPEACIYLDKKARAAYFLAQSQEYGRNGQVALQLRFLRKALTNREDLKDIVQYAVKCMEIQQTTPSSVEAEMQMLSRAIKSNIQILLDAKEWAQADSLLKQLQNITPDDPELIQLLAKIPK